MLQAGGDLDLAQESIAAERRAEFGPQHLERDEAVVLQVTREVHDGHATLPQFTLDTVPVCERVCPRQAPTDHHFFR